MNRGILIAGLMSVTFRSLEPKQIIDLAKQANLKAIGWSADVHVPAADIDRVKEVGEATDSAGLEAASFCSYYRAGIGADSGVSFEKICAAANTLCAPSIRVWAGNKASVKISEPEYSSVIEDSKRIADLANESNLSITFEYHANTLTDNSQSAKNLLEKIDKDNVKLDWQPPNHMDFNQRYESLKNVIDNLANLHVFHWRQNEDGKNQRLTLEQGAGDWESYLQLARSSNSQTRYALMEFVKGETKQQFLEDARVLNGIVGRRDSAPPKATQSKAKD